jgi:hypothetical protein
MHPIVPPRSPHVSSRMTGQSDRADASADTFSPSAPLVISGATGGLTRSIPATRRGQRGGQRA